MLSVMASLPFFIVSKIGYVSSNKRSRVASVVALISLTVALMVVLLTISVTKGFQESLREKIFAFNHRITVFVLNPYGLDSSESDFEVIKNETGSIIPDAIVSRAIAIPVLLKTQENFDNLFLYSSETALSAFEGQLVKGSFSSDNENSIVLSRTTAEKLMVDTGQKIDVLAPVGASFKLRRPVIIGIYDTDFADYDANIAFVPLQFAENMEGSNQQSNVIFAVDFKSNSIDYINQVARVLQERLNALSATLPSYSRFYVSTAIDQAPSYFAWLSILDTNVLIITLLMIFIGSFTLISSSVIIILEQTLLIGMLKVMGAKNYLIGKIFIVRVMITVIASIILSNLIVFIILSLQKSTGFIKLNPEDYYVSQLPVNNSFLNYLLVDVSAVVLSLACIVTVLTIIKRIKPIKVIKFN